MENINPNSKSDSKYENCNYIYFNYFKAKLNINNINLKKIKTINAHNHCIYSISLFPSGNFVSVSGDKTIKIWDENFQIIQIIKKAHDYSIIYVKVKNENNFLTCSFENCIKFWNKEKENNFILKYIINKAHNDIINEIIFFSNGNFISCSSDKSLKLWEEIEKNKYQINTILTHSNWIKAILYLEDKNILISSARDGTKFWNINNYECIKYINENESTSCGTLCRINEDNIFVGGYFIIKIISIKDLKIIKKIKNKFWCHGLCFIKNISIIINAGNKDIRIYNSNNLQLIQCINNAHKDNINGLCILNNGNIISYSYDETINVWSF